MTAFVVTFQRLASSPHHMFVPGSPEAVPTHPEHVSIVRLFAPVVIVTVQAIPESSRVTRQPAGRGYHRPLATVTWYMVLRPLLVNAGADRRRNKDRWI